MTPKTLADAPCGCYGCDQGRQDGHLYCYPYGIPASLLEAERRGEIYRELLDGRIWVWRSSAKEVRPVLGDWLEDFTGTLYREEILPPPSDEGDICVIN